MVWIDQLKRMLSSSGSYKEDQSVICTLPGSAKQISPKNGSNMCIVITWYHLPNINWNVCTFFRYLYSKGDPCFVTDPFLSRTFYSPLLLSFVYRYQAIPASTHSQKLHKYYTNVSSLPPLVKVRKLHCTISNAMWLHTRLFLMSWPVTAKTVNTWFTVYSHNCIVSVVSNQFKNNAYLFSLVSMFPTITQMSFVYSICIKSNIFLFTKSSFCILTLWYMYSFVKSGVFPSLQILFCSLHKTKNLPHVGNQMRLFKCLVNSSLPFQWCMPHHQLPSNQNQIYVQWNMLNPPPPPPPKKKIYTPVRKSCLVPCISVLIPISIFISLYILKSAKMHQTGF